MTKKVVKNLTVLGNKVKPKYSNPTSSMIECFPNPSLNEYSIEFTTDEFSSLCPVTGAPDYGRIEIIYTPTNLCIESKSLKLYLGAYRLYQGFMEKMTNKILSDLSGVCYPKDMQVSGIWKSRGGIVTKVCAYYSD